MNVLYECVHRNVDNSISIQFFFVFFSFILYLTAGQTDNPSIVKLHKLICGDTEEVLFLYFSDYKRINIFKIRFGLIYLHINVCRYVSTYVYC